jgi:hypothetical protein
MGRRPIGSRAMTGIERKHRHAAKQQRELARLKDLAGASQADKNDLPLLNIEHLRLWPDRVAPWLCQRLGRAAALAFYNALGQALADAPEEAVSPQ